MKSNSTYEWIQPDLENWWFCDDQILHLVTWNLRVVVILATSFYPGVNLYNAILFFSLLVATKQQENYVLLINHLTNQIFCLVIRSFHLVAISAGSGAGAGSEALLTDSEVPSANSQALRAFQLAPRLSKLDQRPSQQAWKLSQLPPRSSQQTRWWSIGKTLNITLSNPKGPLW